MAVRIGQASIMVRRTGSGTARVAQASIMVRRNVVVRQNRIYPATFPQPLRSGYRNVADPGIEQGRFRPGRPQQRLRHTVAQNNFRLSFNIDETLYEEWLAYVDLFAFEPAGIEMQLASFGTPTAAGLLSPHDIRFLGSLQANTAGDARLVVTVTAEVVFGGQGSLINAGAGLLVDIIDGGTAANPGPDGPIDGGTAADPGQDGPITSLGPANV